MTTKTSAASRGQDLAPIDFTTDVEVTELHGSFAEAQWAAAVARQIDPWERVVRGWQDTERGAP